MQWAFGSGYHIAHSEIIATFSRDVSWFRSCITQAIAHLKASRIDNLPVNRYWRMVEDILNRTPQTGEADLTRYAPEIDRVSRELYGQVMLYLKPRIEPAFKSGLQLGFAYVKCKAKHGDGVPNDLKAAESSLDEIRKTNLDGFDYDYKSSIAKIKGEYDAGKLDDAASSIHDMWDSINHQFVPP
jgi:hypothetical protein